MLITDTIHTNFMVHSSNYLFIEELARIIRRQLEVDTDSYNYNEIKRNATVVFTSLNTSMKCVNA